MTSSKISRMVVQTIEAKTRKLSATWTVNKPRHSNLSDEEIQQKIEETYDRWCWETGSEEDKKLLEEWEEERDGRADIFINNEMIEELTTAIAEEIRHEIDKEILGKLCEAAKS